MHLWTPRTSHHGRLALAGVFAAAVGGFIVALAAVATADSTWTITYRPTGSGPCSSAPDLTSLTIRTGTTIILTNLTGGPVAVDGAYKKTFRLDGGESASVRLDEGEHDLRLVPDCQVMGPVIGAQVYVETNPPTQGPGIGATPGGAQAETPTASAAHAGDVSVGTGMGSTSPGPTTSLSAVGPPAGESESVGGLGLDQFGPKVRLTDENDHKAVQLVGVVALICILGVAVGIIRVIRAQRATGALERPT